MAISFHWDEIGAGEVCRAVLDALPEWFAIPEAVEDYVTVAEQSPTLIATDSETGHHIGLLTLVTHSRWSAEIYVMGIVPEYHRGGIGRQLVAAAEERLLKEGVEFLQVKTLSERNPDPGCARTRLFYLAYGFRVLEEFPDLWDAENPALQLIKVVGEP
jgi:ribosomal protein S18 acetylase RimI-like enzyme